MGRVPLVLTSAFLPLLLVGVTQGVGVDRDVEKVHSPFVSEHDLGPSMTAHNGQPSSGSSLHDPKTPKSKKSIESLPQADAAAYGCSSCGSSFERHYGEAYNTGSSFGSPGFGPNPYGQGGLPRSTATRHESRSEQRFVNGQQVYDLKHTRRYQNGQLVQDDRRELDEDDFGVPRYTDYGVYGQAGGTAGSTNRQEYNYHQSSSSTGYGHVPNSLPSIASASSSASSLSSVSSDGSYDNFRSEVERLREELHRNTQSIHGSIPGVGGSHRTEYRYETRYVNGKPVYIRNEEKKYKDGQLIHDMTEEKGPDDLGTEHLVSDHDQEETHSQATYTRPYGYSRNYYSERNEEYGTQDVGQTLSYPSDRYPQGSYPQGSYPQGTNPNYSSESNYQYSAHSSAGQDTYRTPGGSYPTYRPRTPSTDYSPSTYDSRYSTQEARTSHSSYPSTSSVSQVSQDTRESSYTGQYDGSYRRPQIPHRRVNYGETSSVTQVSRDDVERTTSSPSPVSTQVSSYNTFQDHKHSYDQSFDRGYDYGYEQFPSTDDTDLYPPPSEHTRPATYGSSSQTTFDETQTHRQTSYPSSVSHTAEERHETEHREYQPAPSYTVSPTHERQPPSEVPQTSQREPTYPYRRPSSSRVEQQTQYTSTSVASGQHSSPYGRTPDTPYQSVPDDFTSSQRRPASQGSRTAVTEREETHRQTYHGYQPQAPEVSTQVTKETSQATEESQHQLYRGYQPQRPGSSPHVHDSTRSTVERQQTYHGYQPQSPATSTYVTHESSRTTQDRQSNFPQTPDQARTTTFDLTNSYGTDTSITDQLLDVNTASRQDTYGSVDEQQQTSTTTRVVQDHGSRPDSAVPQYPRGPQRGNQLTYEERRRQHQEWYGRDQYDRAGSTQVQTEEKVDSAEVDSSQDGYSVIPGVIRGPETSPHYAGNEEADKERYDISPFDDDDNEEGEYLEHVDNEIVTDGLEENRRSYETSQTSSQTVASTARGTVPTSPGTVGYDRTQVTTSYTPAATSYEDRRSHTSITQEQQYAQQPVQVSSSYSNYSYSQQHSSVPGPDVPAIYPVSSSVSTSEESLTSGSLLPQTSDHRTEVTTRRKFVNGQLVSEQHFERRFQNGELVHENRTNLNEDELQRSAALDTSTNYDVYGSYPYTSQAQRHELHQVKKFINGQQVYELHHERQFQDGDLIHENKTEKNADDFDASNLAMTGHEVTQQQHLQQQVYTDRAPYGGTPGVSSLATEERHVKDSKDFIVTPKYYTRRSEVRQQKEYVNGQPIYDLHHERRFEDGQLVHENKTELTEEDLQGKEVHEDALHAILARKLAVGTTSTAESGVHHGVSHSQSTERQEQYQETVHGDTSSGHLIKGCLTCVLTAGPSAGRTSSSSSSAASSSFSSYSAGSPILGHPAASEVAREGGYSQKTEHTMEEHYENGALVEGKEESRKWRNGQLVHEDRRSYSGGDAQVAQTGKVHQQSPYTQSSPVSSYRGRGYQGGRASLRQGVSRGHSRSSGDTGGACASNPCLNGGTCKQRGRDAYTCVCKFGFRGSECQEAYCPIRFCRHGGECNTEDGRHICTCRPGYFGERCGSKQRRGSHHSRRHSART